MKLFVDTNIWLRYLIRDNEKQFGESVRLFELIESGEISPYTSTIVLLEVQYVLEKVYKVSRLKLLENMDLILNTRKLVVIEKTDFEKAWRLYKRKKQKLSDYLIVTQVPEKVSLCSFDEDLVKLAKKRGMSPAKAVDMCTEKMGE